MKIKVLLQYDSLWHYRKSLFSKLGKTNKLDFYIACGEKSVYTNLKTFKPEDNLKVHYIKNRLFFDRIGFIWQSGLFKIYKKINPDIIILKGVDLHILSNLLLFFYLRVFTKKKIVFWGHATFGKQGNLGKKIRLIFYRLASGILVYDDKGKERLIENRIPASRIFVIGNCINDEDVPVKNNINTFEPNSIIFTGRFYDLKKLDVLLKAVALAKERGKLFKIHLVGDGPEKEKLISLTSELNIKGQVKFYGSLYGQQVSELYEKSQLSVIPSSVGLSLYHSFAHGVPVVTDDDYILHGPEFNDLIEGVNGLIYKKNDAEDLTNKLTLNSNQFNNLRADCLNFFLNNCTSEIVKDKFVKAMININSK